MGALLPMLLAAAPALADDAGPPKLDSGDTAWMLASTALVLMMTVPGLALFYGGMVRKKNILATLMQCFVITCIVTIVWTVAGYSLAFTPGNIYVGDLSRFMLHGIADHDRRPAELLGVGPAGQQQDDHGDVAAAERHDGSVLDEGTALRLARRRVDQQPVDGVAGGLGGQAQQVGVDRGAPRDAH